MRLKWPKTVVDEQDPDYLAELWDRIRAESEIEKKRQEEWLSRFEGGAK